MKNPPSDQPDPVTVAYDDGRHGRELFNHYNRLGDQEVLDAFNAGLRDHLKYGDPEPPTFKLF